MEQERFGARLKPAALDEENIRDYWRAYSRLLHESLSAVEPEALRSAFELMSTALRDRRTIFVAGNGGSAAVANHLCCDWMKGTAVTSQPSLKVLSLTSNVPLITALANDLSYERVFASQLELLAEKNDLVVLISTSGLSPNIIEAAKTARGLALKRIGMTGFEGGELATLVDAHLHIPAHNYGVVEDAHQALMHIFAQFLLRQRQKLSK